MRKTNHFASRWVVVYNLSKAEAESFRSLKESFITEKYVEKTYWMKIPLDNLASFTHKLYQKLLEKNLDVQIKIKHSFK